MWLLWPLKCLGRGQKPTVSVSPEAAAPQTLQADVPQPGHPLPRQVSEQVSIQAQSAWSPQKVTTPRPCWWK